MKMKTKSTLMVLALTAALVLSTGCANTPSGSDNSLDDSTVSYEPPSDPASGTENKGEPTFLICPDGTPVYTSEITSVFTGSDGSGDRKEITIDEAEKLAREGGNFTVICSGFAYAYISENAFNRIDNPDMFGPADDVIGLFGTEGGTEFFHYIGEEIPGSTEFIRLKTGGKIGSLTVKSAAAYFGNADSREFSDKPGNFLQGGSVEFDGELELSGYISVSSFNEFYNSGGYVTFCPDSDSCSKLPMFDGRWDSELGGFAHSPYESSEGYYGDLRLNLGNINELTVDTGDLKYGDTLVKSTIVIDDIKFEFDPMYGSNWNISLKQIKL